MAGLKPWLGAVLVAGVACALLAGSFGWPAPPMDEGQLLVYPELLLAGEVPHRDFEHVYGPGNVWLLAAVYRATGASIEAERAVGLTLRLVLVLSLYAASLFRGTLVATCVGLLSAAVLVPLGVAAYAWLTGLALAVAGLVLVGSAEAGHLRRALGGGALAGASLLVRPDLAVAVFAALVLLAARTPAQARAIGVGALLGLAPYGVHLAWAGPGNVVRGLILDPVLRTGPARLLSAPPLGTDDRVLLAVLLTSAALLVAASARAGLAAPREDRRFQALALFALALLPQALQYVDGVHLRYVAAVVVALAPLALAQLARRSLAPALGALALLLVPQVGATAWSLATFSAPVTFLEHQGRRYPVPTSDAPVYSALLAAVEAHSTPGQRLFVGPADLRITEYGDTFLYHLLPRLPPGSFYTEMQPGVANGEDSRLAADLERTDVVVLDSRVSPPVHLFPGRVGPDAPNEILRSRFRRVWQQGFLQLLVRER